MTAQHTHPRRRLARATRLLAATIGLVAASALAFPSMAPAAPPAQRSLASQLSAANDASRVRSPLVFSTVVYFVFPWLQTL